MTAFVDDKGQTWRVIFDSSGEVVTNTLPVTLTDKLILQLNPSAGLQYTGQRYYTLYLDKSKKTRSFKLGSF